MRSNIVSIEVSEEEEKPPAPKFPWMILGLAGALALFGVMMARRTKK